MRVSWQHHTPRRRTDTRYSSGECHICSSLQTHRLMRYALFSTNHVGHAFLTKLLLPTLLKTAEQPNSDVRIVNVSSEGHYMAPGIIYDQDKLETYYTWRRYGQSKLANILHARELQRRYPQITATSLHPGVIFTDLYAASMKTNPLLKISMPLMSGVLLDVPGGAKNSLWAATADRNVVASSHYWKPVGSKSGGSFWYARKPELATELWDWTESQLEMQLKKLS